MTEKNVLLTLRAISFLVFAGFFVFHVFSDKIKSALLLEGCYLVQTGGLEPSTSAM